LQEADPKKGHRDRTVSKKYRKDMERRVERQKAFYERSDAGDLLCSANRWGRYAILDQAICPRLHEGPVEDVLKPPAVEKMIATYVRMLRESYETVYAIDDDVLPCAEVYWGIGGITAAMTCRDPVHDGGTSWFEPNLPWEQIEDLKFDPDNKWVQFALRVNQALWRHWDEDFFILPFLHRSPLDAANGIRGTDLFLEIYTEPDKVKRLTEWCADWSIGIENFIYENVDYRRGWGTGVWGSWMPDRGVFVNGDPVGLISREMQREFEGMFTEKLFTRTGGGYFHNHAIGIHQVDLVCRTKGTLIQEIGPDPNQPHLPDLMLRDSALSERVVEASFHTPILLDNIAPNQVDEILPILKRGRFMLGMLYWEGFDPNELVKKVRAASNLK